jgi:hypothetical protein
MKQTQGSSRLFGPSLGYPHPARLLPNGDRPGSMLDLSTRGVVFCLESPNKKAAKLKIYESGFKFEKTLCGKRISIGGFGGSCTPCA